VREAIGMGTSSGSESMVAAATEHWTHAALIP